jgi:hypothetical protein
MFNRYRVGDKVVYVRDKYSSRPSPRAKNLFASPNGEAYSYQVEKYWVVKNVLADDQLVVCTRRGKTHAISIHDRRLRRATLIERIWNAKRFPSLGAHAASLATPAG